LYNDFMAKSDRGELVLDTLPITRPDGEMPEGLRDQARLAAANFIYWTTPWVENYLRNLPEDGLSDHVCAMIVEGSEDIGRLIFRTHKDVMLADLIVDRPDGSKARLAMIYDYENGVDVVLPETEAERIELVTILDRLIPIQRDDNEFGLKIVEDVGDLGKHEFAMRELRTQMSDAEWEETGLTTGEIFKWKAEAELPGFISRVSPAVTRAWGEERKGTRSDLVLEVMTVEGKAPGAVSLTIAGQHEFQQTIGDELYEKFTKGLGPPNPYSIGRISIHQQSDGVVLQYERTGWWAEEHEPGGLVSNLVINISTGELLSPGLILGEGIEGKLETLRKLVKEINELLEGEADGTHFRNKGESGGKLDYVARHEPGTKKPVKNGGNMKRNTRLM
jgi:hypothetical protein